MTPSGPPRPTECLGAPLPARAAGTPGPYKLGPEAHGLPGYWPTAGWQMQPPEMLGLDPAKLMAAADFSTQFSTTQAVVVIRHGYIALEKYVGSFGMSSTHESYSMAKSFASALIGIAIGEGKLKSTDEKICTYYPEDWDCADPSDPRSRITVEHAMNLNTGLRWSENWRSDASGTNDAFNPSLLSTVLARQSVEEPGVNKRYSTGDPALLTGVLQETTGMSAFNYGKMKIFDVIGAGSVRWNSDAGGRTTTYAGLQANARDYAKFGYLYLQRGQWEGKQVVPMDWIDRTTQAAKPCEDWNQWLWHVNPPIRLGTQPASCDSFYCTPTAVADLPPEAYFAEGINGQFIFIIPSADMVVVRLGMDSSGSEHWDDFARGFLSAMLDAVK
jgi:CubicO group peptidase (beta-lactamase class C family)